MLYKVTISGTLSRRSKEYHTQEGGFDAAFERGFSEYLQNESSFVLEQFRVEKSFLDGKKKCFFILLDHQPKRQYNIIVEKIDLI